MRSFLPLAILGIAAIGCTTPYKSGQTPDDVYFSPTRPRTEYVRAEAQEDSYADRSRADEERYLRLRVRNRSRWSSIDDYYRDPYAYSYGGGYYYSDYNPRLYWSYYYAPAHPYVYYFPKALPPNTPRKFNFDSYKPPTPTPAPASPYAGKPVYNTYPSGSQGSTRGGSIRDVFQSSGSSTRSSSSSSSSSGSSSSGSSSGSKSNGNAGVRRF